MKKTKKELEQEKFEMLVNKGGYTEEEARDLIECDKAIDKGEKMSFDLPPDKMKIAKQYIDTKCQKRVENTQRGKAQPVNNTKQAIINKIYEGLTENADFCQDCSITNKERQIFFIKDGKKYELTLVQKRK